MKSYLGMYDVSCPKVRGRLFQILSSYGIHRQKSVFECKLNAQQKKQLLQQLDFITQQHNARILFIEIYPKHPQSLLFGCAKTMPISDCLYVG